VAVVEGAESAQRRGESGARRAAPAAGSAAKSALTRLHLANAKGAQSHAHNGNGNGRGKSENLLPLSDAELAAF
jgi:hypothetical protein